MNNVTYLLVALAISATWSRPEQNGAASHQVATTKPKPGIVSGRVFAITKSGDLKPGRMAELYLIPSSPSRNGGASIAGDWFYDVSLEILKMEAAHMRAGVSLDDLNLCREELGAYDNGLEKLLESSIRTRSFEQTVVLGKADEDGNFRLALPHSGTYTMVARGRAGFNDAVWTEDFVVESGKTTSIKLSSPTKSCLDLGDTQ